MSWFTTCGCAAEVDSADVSHCPVCGDPCDVEECE